MTSPDADMSLEQEQPGSPATTAASTPLPQTPLGGVLVDRVLTGDALLAARERADGLPRLMVDREAEVTFEMIATGVFSPLVGPLREVENAHVLESGRLLDGTPWPIPLSFAPAGTRNAEVLRSLRGGEEVLLVDRSAEGVALLRVEEVGPCDRERRAQALFGTTDANEHPGVASIFTRMGEVGVAGPIELLQRADWGVFERYRITPAEAYDLFYRRRGYCSVAGFITGANPPHVGHEYMHRAALELVDAVFLLPQVEIERPEYIEGRYRLMALEALRDVYYPPFRVVLAALRSNYLFAGPREAILHALVMRNYGCTHALIGRDHAGVGDRFDMYAGQQIFDEYRPGELGIQALFFSEIFYCTRCRMPATERTCPHDARYRLQISGTGIREVLRRGFFPPKEICRPEVSHIAMQGVVPPGLDEEGQGVYPVGQTVHSLFPFYEVASRLGGYLRPEIVPPESMTDRDLEAALLDVRSHADRIYTDLYVEMVTAAESNPSLAQRWRAEAREILVDHQAEVVAHLSETGVAADGAAEGVPDGSGGLGEPGERKGAEDPEQEIARAQARLDRYPRPLHPTRPPDHR